MQKLLYYAKGFDNFVLYADRGVSGNTPTRPALNALKADIAAGFIDRIVVNDTSRIARDMTLLMRFTEWAAHRAEIISISEGAHMERFYADVYGSMYRALTERGQGYD
jgi:DNA invertase Pin-like site-specific DNA recombinase